MRDTTKAENHLTPGATPQPPVPDGGVAPGALPATVFGPVKKFRPVMCQSVEKDTSLHSSLMEEIQAGRGKERLKKVRFYSTKDGWTDGSRSIIMPSGNYEGRFMISSNKNTKINSSFDNCIEEIVMVFGKQQINFSFSFICRYTLLVPVA